MPPEGFAPIEGSYSEHIGGAWTHPKTGAVYFLTTWRKDSKGTYWLQVWEDLPPYGDPKEVHKWGADPWGHGTQTWLPDGSLYVAVSGNVDGSGKTKPSVHIEPGMFPPIPLDGSPHSATPTPIGKHITDLLSPTSATSMLYDKSYVPGDLDTPGKLAVRISKQLFALNEQGAALKELVELLRKAGVLG